MSTYRLLLCKGCEHCHCQVTKDGLALERAAPLKAPQQGFEASAADEGNEGGLGGGRCSKPCKDVS